MAFSTAQRVFIVELQVQPRSDEAVEQSRGVRFPDAVLPDKSTMFWFADERHDSVPSSYRHVEVDPLMSAAGWGTISTYVAVT
jgi:hypothetical protein